MFKEKSEQMYPVMGGKLYTNLGLLVRVIDPTMLLPPSENLFKCDQEVLSWQPMIPPNRFDIFFFP